MSERKTRADKGIPRKVADPEGDWIRYFVQQPAHVRFFLRDKLDTLEIYGPQLNPATERVQTLPVPPAEENDDPDFTRTLSTAEYLEAIR